MSKDQEIPANFMFSYYINITATALTSVRLPAAGVQTSIFRTDKNVRSDFIGRVSGEKTKLMYVREVLIYSRVRARTHVRNVKAHARTKFDEIVFNNNLL